MTQTETPARHGNTMPRTPHNPEQLSDLSSFTRSVATTLAAQTTYPVSQLTIVIGRYSEWARRERALPLLPGLIFDKQVIALYVRDARAQKRISHSSAATYRSILNRASEMYLPDDRADAAPSVPATSPLDPYSTEEQAAIRAWTKGQRGSDLHKGKAVVLASLGLGCGLRAGEILALRRHDVSIDGTDVTITATYQGQVRQVPMLSSWTRAFIAFAEDRTGEDYIFGKPTRDPLHPNAISDFIRTSSGRDKPNTYRMRSTWIIGHLAAGADLPTLLSAAGLDRLEKLSDYLQHLPQPTDASFARLRKEVTR